MREIYSKIPELFKEGRSCVLATLIRMSGSGPREAGTKFLVMEDGSTVGTIGGGLLEVQVVEAAKKVLETGLPLRLGYSLQGTDVAETGMLCGGDAEVFLESIGPGNLNYLHIFQRMEEIEKRGGSGLLVTLVDEKSWREGQVPKMLLERTGEKLGSILEEDRITTAIVEDMERFLKKRQPSFLECQVEGGRHLDLFVERVAAQPILYVFGGGHVSAQISPLAARVGFKVVVIDDRPEFADPSRFPEAREVLQMPFKGALERLDVDESSYVVIVTRGHIHDKSVLEQCLKTKARYVGMIGSRRKKALVYTSLLEQGFTEEELERVHSPIGIDIGAETPEEIAVSIVAELIMVRAGGGRH
jgi:xanthine dehydrogenase accessory factor